MGNRKCASKQAVSLLIKILAFNYELQNVTIISLKGREGLYPGDLKKRMIFFFVYKEMGL